MERRNLRPRGVMVYPMSEAVSGPPVFGTYALCIRHSDGAVRMVHTEGVAYEVTDDKPWCWSDYQPDLKKWSPAELKAIVDFTDDEFPPSTDLADWVADRNKDRLESNFSMIYAWAIS